jgi:MFS family permease
MLGVALFGLPMVVMGVAAQTVPVLVVAVLAGMGIELFGLGWNLAMQEHVPAEMLSRVYSYDMLGSFVAIPIGQIAVGPLAIAFGYGEVLMVSGALYVVTCLLVLLSPAVRRLPRVTTTTSEPAPAAP